MAPFENFKEKKSSDLLLNQYNQYVKTGKLQYVATGNNGTDPCQYPPADMTGCVQKTFPVTNDGASVHVDCDAICSDEKTPGDTIPTVS